MNLIAKHGLSSPKAMIGRALPTRRSDAKHGLSSPKAMIGRALPTRRSEGAGK